MWRRTGHNSDGKGFSLRRLPTRVDAPAWGPGEARTGNGGGEAHTCGRHRAGRAWGARGASQGNTTRRCAIGRRGSLQRPARRRRVPNHGFCPGQLTTRVLGHTRQSGAAGNSCAKTSTRARHAVGLDLAAGVALQSLTPQPARQGASLAYAAAAPLPRQLLGTGTGARLAGARSTTCVGDAPDVPPSAPRGARTRSRRQSQAG